MTTSTTGKLASALAKAQGTIRGAKKDADNPFFKTTYADLASVWEACRAALSENELSVVQPTDIMDGAMVLKTILLHSSGESIVGILPIQAPEKATAQQVGSAITYARRYGLAAMVGVAPEDDDGNEASTATAKTNFRKTPDNAPSLPERASKLGSAIAGAKSQADLDKVVAQGNTLLAELKIGSPSLYDDLMKKITDRQSAFIATGASP